MTNYPQLSDEQLASIRAYHDRTTHPDWREETHIGQLLAEVARLRAERDQLRERLDSYGSPVLKAPPLPPPDPGHERQRALRAELATGFTTQAWAVGKVLCPAGARCTAGLISVFEPTKRGRLPIHRGSYGQACSGSGEKATPLKLATRSAP